MFTSVERGRTDESDDSKTGAESDDAETGAESDDAETGVNEGTAIGDADGLTIAALV